MQHEVPDFSATDVSIDLIHLAERCLLKEPAARIDVVSWENFDTEPLTETPADTARKALALRQKITMAEKPPPDSSIDRKIALEDIAQQIRNVIRTNSLGKAFFRPSQYMTCVNT